MNSLRQFKKLRIEGANHDSRVILGPCEMQTQEIPAIMRQQIRPSRAANASTSESGTEAFAFPASIEVSTSCPRRLNSDTAGSGMFSLE